MKDLVFEAPPTLIRRYKLRNSTLPILFFLIVVTVASASGCGSSRTEEQQLIVSAAMSLSDAFEEIKAEFEKTIPAPISCTILQPQEISRPRSSRERLWMFLLRHQRNRWMSWRREGFW